MDATREGDRSTSGDANGETSVRVGVLSFHESKETKAICNAVRALGHDPVWLHEGNTRSWLDGGTPRFEPAVDVVANRLLATKALRPLDDLGVATSYAAVCPVLNPVDAVIRAMHKYGAAATLAAAGVSVPDAFLAFTHQAIADRDHLVDGPVVHKPAIGTGGDRIAIVGGDGPVSPRVARRLTFLQAFLDSGTDRPFDVRVYVVDDEVVGAMKRYAPADEWRTNVALGGTVEDFTAELPSEAAQLSRRATDVLGLDYAGVDLMCHAGTWYVLEVNVTAGFKGLFAATGTSPAPHIAGLAIERAGGRVDAERVASLTTELDDSIPEGAPVIGSDASAKGTVGYTERVAVGGEDRIEETVAKSDTGATRTSIDTELAARIGAGPIVDTVTVRSGTRTGRRKRPLVEIDLELADRWDRVTASVEDRSHLNYPVLLGRDVLRGHRVDIERRVSEE
ncbi:ATP-grasp domain-containing protein [Halorubrum sp. JWXQ-INN 858]|uniref:putative ATP-dependent zinc protease n=1 Tax=Halorubrum sp. JWXQ-INN 858 TaxID=2690782 RepID=UPI00135C5B20|nr:RimK/LysX family protein [Halorubrum sp. JWXQ-INN 858]MWV66027.1 ATP-grasp domain-containing protein [Halorubrum sp. JWXQ-INN 858]